MPVISSGIEAASVRSRHDLDAGSSAPARTNGADATKQDIIDVSMAEFAAKGFTGARVDEIALRMKTSKRMIYYYFGSKEKLYLAVLEEAYRRIRECESTLRLDHLPPEEALRRLVGFTFDYQNSHPDFVRLVMIENIHRGENIAKSERIRDLNVSIIDSLRQILDRGRQAGVFRPDLDPVDVHATISALCFYNVANRYTFAVIFKRDLGSKEHLQRRRQSVIETVLRFVQGDDGREPAGAPPETA